MGNTVSAAEVVAAGITHAKNQDGLVPPQNHQHYNMAGAVPPPECPMHQKIESKPSANECPVMHPDNSDINPYNMVNDKTKFNFNY